MPARGESDRDDDRGMGNRFITAGVCTDSKGMGAMFYFICLNNSETRQF